jgi:release factor glutamine methyltransferase
MKLSLIDASQRLLRPQKTQPRNDIQNNLALLRTIESQLKSAGVLSPRIEAEALVMHFGQMTRLDFYTGKKKVDLLARRVIKKALEARKKGTPLSYLTNEAGFYGYMFGVTKDVLIPRPETECLVEETIQILDRYYTDQKPEILDVGTGSGCVGVSLTLQRPDCRMTALDASIKALKVARKNVELFGLSDKIQLIHGRLFDPFGKNKKAFWDIVVSNPPYVAAEDWPKLSREVRSEPRLALDGGVHGLEMIDRMLKQAPFFIKKSGWLLIEIGRGQSRFLARQLKYNKDFHHFHFVKDLNGIERVLVAQKNKGEGGL